MHRSHTNELHEHVSKPQSIALLAIQSAACNLQDQKCTRNSETGLNSSQKEFCHQSKGASGSSQVRKKCSLLAANGPTLRPASVFITAMDLHACWASVAYHCAIAPNECSSFATVQACFWPQSIAHRVLAHVFCRSVRSYAAAVLSSLSEQPFFVAKADRTS
jgi:hypothetical protein